MTRARFVTRAEMDRAIAEAVAATIAHVNTELAKLGAEVVASADQVDTAVAQLAAVVTAPGVN